MESSGQHVNTRGFYPCYIYKQTVSRQSCNNFRVELRGKVKSLVMQARKWRNKEMLHFRQDIFNSAGGFQRRNGEPAFCSLPFSVTMMAILTGRMLRTNPCLQGMWYYDECNGETLAVIDTDEAIEKMHGVRKRLCMCNEDQKNKLNHRELCNGE